MSLDAIPCGFFVGVSDTDLTEPTSNQRVSDFGCGYSLIHKILRCIMPPMGLITLCIKNILFMHLYQAQKASDWEAFTNNGVTITGND